MRLKVLLSFFVVCVLSQLAYTQPAQGSRPPQSGGFGQPPAATSAGVVRGTLLDFKTKQPVEYASVTLFNETDGKLVTGGVTNERGKFEITGVPYGNFFMTISFIGFAADTVRNLAVTEQKPELKLDDVFLRSAEVNLGEVTVQGQKDQLEYNLDKKIINVDKDIAATGASALEVMKNVPSVAVDIDGTVTLRGSNANILIDGKPSSMQASILLEQLPSEMIDRIEIVTNPSSRYEAEGMSGIINIVTKKNKQQGLNGVANVSIGTRHKYTAGVNLNYRNKKVNYFLGLNGTYNHRFAEGESYREYYSNDTLQFLNQESYSLRRMQNYNGKAGMDISFTDRTSLSLTGSLRRGLGDEEEDIDYRIRDAEEIEELYQRTSNEDEDNLNYDLSAGFRRIFPTKGKEWTIDASYSSDNSEENMHAVQNNLIPVSLPDNQQRTSTIEHNRVGMLQSDFVLPVEKIGRFEMGVKGTYRTADNDLHFDDFDPIANDWIDNEGKTNRFQYDEVVFAGYVIYGNKYKNLSYQAGLRYEGTLTESYQYVNDSTFENDYHKLFPSAHLRYALGKENEISLSYSKRISRPGIWSLNPFPEYNDPLSLRIGNPALQPEMIHSVELSHTKAWKKLSLTSTAFYRNTQDVIMRYTTIDTFGVSRFTSLNLTQSHSFGAEFVFNMNLFKWWRFNSNFSYFRQVVEGRDSISGSDNFNYTGRVSTTFSFWKGMDIQLSGFFRSKALNAQGYTRAMYSMDFGIKKEILKGKGSISLSGTDIFNTRRWRSVTEDDGFYAESWRRRESQVFTLGFTYKINNGNTRKEKRRGEDGGGGMDMDME